MNKIYKILLKRKISDLFGYCDRCGLNSGCNSRNRVNKIKNWKEYRKTQWK